MAYPGKSNYVEMDRFDDDLDSIDIMKNGDQFEDDFDLDEETPMLARRERRWKITTCHNF